MGWGSVQGSYSRSKSNKANWESYILDKEIIDSRNYDSRFGNDVQEYGITPTVDYDSLLQIIEETGGLGNLSRARSDARDKMDIIHNRVHRR